jgi:hypothetical protein
MTEELKRFARESGEIVENDERRVPDRRGEGWHQELADELTAHADRIETRLRKFYSRALGAFAVIGIASAVALAGFGVVLNAQTDTTQAIQSQRYDSILQTCLDTNVRHDNAIAKIKDAAAQAPKRQRDPKTLAAFTGIIEATVPYTTDCRVFAKERLKGR